MELRDVETFLALAEELHFGRTAQRLYLSTGRVSQSIRGLENEIGAPLFARNSRQVRLTALGRQFRTDAQSGLDQLQGALRKAQDCARGVNGVLRVGYVACVGGPFISTLVSAFHARHATTRAVMTALPLATGFTTLRHRQIDLLVVWSPGGDAAAVSGDGRATGPILATDQRAVLVPSGHPLADHREISIEQVADYELLDLPSTTPASLARAWTPRHTPSGKPLRRGPKTLEALVGQDTIPLLDLLSTVEHEQLAHLTIRSLLRYQPYPGLVLVPITDLPPCVMVPVWQPEFETAATRAFVDVAARPAADHDHSRLAPLAV